MGDHDIEAEGGNPQDVNVPKQTPQPLSTAEKRKIYLQLYQSALNGDWDAAKSLYEKYQNEVGYNAKINRRRETALHIAAAAEHTHFVDQLIKKMSDEDLALPNEAGNTAFCLAAVSGKVELVEVMMKRKKDLAMVRGRGERLPIFMAALLGHRKVVRCLYKATKDELSYNDRKDLVVTMINTDIYDVALEILKADRKLAIDRDRNDETALHALAQKSCINVSISHQRLPGIWQKCINLLSGSNIVHEHSLMHKKALELVRFIWDEVVAQDDAEISKLIGKPWRLIFTAAEKGNVEFLTILLQSYPDLIFKVEDNRYSIFHIAVLHRHEDIFKLIHKIGSIKNLITTYADEHGNNMLHLAAKLPLTMSRLHVVPGAALQLQRELLWFEEVKKVVQPRHLEATNNDDLTPGALLMKEHGDLMKRGEKWMRGTANSCMVVATLIATVVFAATFTVPGGNNQGNGIPIFLKKIAFKIFAVSDALSLISSVSSVLTFLSILTSRYALYDFHWSLPNKLIIGLTTLFISIVAMLIAFMAALFIVFNHGHRLIWYAIPLAAVASLPVILFVLQHYILFLDVIKSTYMSQSLFQTNKSPLFSARVDGKSVKH